MFCKFPSNSCIFFPTPSQFSVLIFIFSFKASKQKENLQDDCGFPVFHRTPIFAVLWLTKTTELSYKWWTIFAQKGRIQGSFPWNHVSTTVEMTVTVEMIVTVETIVTVEMIVTDNLKIIASDCTLSTIDSKFMQLICQWYTFPEIIISLSLQKSICKQKWN